MTEDENPPAEFAEVVTSPPVGRTIDQNILDPVLFISREGNRYVARLGATKMRKGVSERLLAPSATSNWVQSDHTINPLPRDISAIVEDALKGMDADDLTFPQVLELQRNPPTDISVQVDESVQTSANEMALQEERVVVPGLQADLYGYQAQGIAWMHETLARTGGLILADEMGLGKTVQIIGAMLLDRPDRDRPALVVCPTTLIANWVREIAKFAPGLSVLVHRGADRARLHRDLMCADVVVTTYETVVNDLVLFKAVHWSWLVCDEAQAIKNPASQRRCAVSELSRGKSVPVTGTPVENTLLDLWSLADIAIPGLLGPQVWFENNFPDTEDGARAVASITNPIVLKRQVRDVAQDLPERIDVEVPVELTPELAFHYNRVLDETLERYPNAGPLVATGQLQIFCAHPWLRCEDVTADGWEDRINLARSSGVALMTPKLQRAVELLTEAFANGRKVLVFANFNACGPLLQEAAFTLPAAFWGAINGSTPAGDRQRIIDDFAAHNGPAVLVLNPRAAGAGLNITAATVVIHFTQVWNPALELQASARAHRRGQTEPVTIYHMFYVDTVEEVMMQRAQRRRELGSEAVPVSTTERADLDRALSLRPETQ